MSTSSRPRKSRQVGSVDPVLARLGARVRELRLDKGLTQELLADESEIERTRIGKIENGRVNPSILTLAAICFQLGITLADLFEGVRVAKKPIASGGTPRRANQATSAVPRRRRSAS